MIDIDNAKNIFSEISGKLWQCERFQGFVVDTTGIEFTSSEHLINFVFEREWNNEQLKKLYDNHPETDILNATFIGDEDAFNEHCPRIGVLSVDERYRVLWLYSMIIQLEVTCASNTRHKIEECFSKHGLNIELILPSESEPYIFHEPVFQHVKPDGETVLDTTTLVMDMLQY